MAFLDKGDICRRRKCFHRTKKQTASVSKFKVTLTKHSLATSHQAAGTEIPVPQLELLNGMVDFPWNESEGQVLYFSLAKDKSTNTVGFGLPSSYGRTQAQYQQDPSLDSGPHALVPSSDTPGHSSSWIPSAGSEEERSFPGAHASIPVLSQLRSDWSRFCRAPIPKPTNGARGMERADWLSFGPRLRL